MTSPPALDPYLLCPLFPRSTGLPATVFARERAADGGRYGMTLAVEWNSDYALLAFDADPVRLVQGPELPQDVLDKIAAWTQLNFTALGAYWYGQLDGPELARCLQPLFHPR
jgi:hypothetical protein